MERPAEASEWCSLVPPVLQGTQPCVPLTRVSTSVNVNGPLYETDYCEGEVQRDTVCMCASVHSEREGEAGSTAESTRTWCLEMQQQHFTYRQFLR